MNEAMLREALSAFAEQLASLLQKTLPEEGATPVKEDGRLSHDIMAELISHEGIVLEAYKDSKNIWTWGIGVTAASGHKVLRYKDNPQTLSKVFDIFDWLLRTKYLPAVVEAFDVPLTKEQTAAALSFHYNTGAIGRASWVSSFNAGNTELAKQQFMNWRSPKEIIPRREAERDLFFDGTWANNGTALVYSGVSKPGYRPIKPKRIDITKELSAWASSVES